MCLLNFLKTDEKRVNCGRRQGCLLSALLFSIFLNDLIQPKNEHAIGNHVDNQRISMLEYANDIVLLAQDEMNWTFC